jgi:hypothetical protein
MNPMNFQEMIICIKKSYRIDCKTKSCYECDVYS